MFRNQFTVHVSSPVRIALQCVQTLQAGQNQMMAQLQQQQQAQLQLQQQMQQNQPPAPVEPGPVEPEPAPVEPAPVEPAPEQPTWLRQCNQCGQQSYFREGCCLNEACVTGLSFVMVCFFV